MSFLYRLPLFHFNIEDPAILEQNRETILTAINLSSAGFFRELEGKPFSELDYKLRIKLRKYLIRGRYRPTPFGKFAGVGTGTWGKELKLTFPLKTKEITEKRTTESNVNPFESNYHLIPGLHKKHGYYHAMVYDTIDQHWTGCKLPQNSLFETLIQSATKQPLNFKRFQQLLHPQETGKDTGQVENLWEQILDTGFFVPEHANEIPPTGGIDLVLENDLEVPQKIKQQLHEFIDSAGGLFSAEESRYMHDFKQWFTLRFDDRFVSLSHLLEESDFLSGRFHSQSQSSKAGVKDLATTILGNQDKKKIDLQKTFPKEGPDKGIYDIQLLFRLDSLGNPVIENMVCNRPFVYTGRFNKDAQLETHTQKIKKRIYTDKEAMYSHIQVLESASIQHICDVANIFDYEITPFTPQKQNQLGFDELYMGICRNRIQLIHRPSGRQVIPVVMHPLNGDRITHPILRLLWETAHQDRYKFLPYQSSTLSNIPYCPQLNWGKICLQSSRWKLDGKGITDLKDLTQKLDGMELPHQILAGNMDRELLLNPNNPDDLEILHQELKRNKFLNLSDPAWFPSGIFRSADGAAAYPQFVFHYSRPHKVPEVARAFNPITQTQKNCLCFTITVCDSEVPEVLERLFHHIDTAGIQSKVPSWFFLIYGKNGATEIRLRLLDIAPKTQQILLSRFGSMFSQESWDWKIASYYPETFKYGTKGLETSHRLFHLESKFLAAKTDGILHLNYSPDHKEDLIVRLWQLILTQPPNYCQLFGKLKEDVKSMPSDLVKTYKSAFKYLGKSKKEVFDLETYLDTIRSHEFFYAVGKPAIPFLLNHLHMMVNRFFPMDTQCCERRIRYRLYRETGKHIYSVPRATTASFPKPEFIRNS